MSDVFPTDRQISMTCRGLEPPQLRVTRFNRGRDTGESLSLGSSKSPILSGGVLGEFLRRGAARIYNDFQVAPDDPAFEYLCGQRSLMTIPLFDHGKSVSMVILTREQPDSFERADLPHLVWICNLFSRALQAQVNSDRLQTVCDLASYNYQLIGELQHDLIPKTPPRIPGLEFATYYRTVEQAGGDYFDFFPLSDRKVGVLLADVSGHGIHAAVLQAITHSLVHAYPEPPHQPGKVLRYLNAHLSRHYTQSSGSFVTAIYAIFDCVTQSFRYATAGHPPFLKCQAGSNHWVATSAPVGLPLGVTPRDNDYPEHVIPFAPGDRVVLFTDGIVEAINSQGESFGLNRLKKTLHDCPDHAQGVVDTVIETLNDFVGSKTMLDDRTLLVARRVHDPVSAG
jgi:sigma-B regulation protein RsbU (phosphoserine phosphatase)